MVMWMKSVAVMSLALALAGCEAHDRMMATDFRPTGSGRFEFKTLAAPQYPLDTAEGESARMRMLDEWISKNAYCSGAGYEIVSRRPIQRSAFVHDVYYEGRCKA